MSVQIGIRIWNIKKYKAGYLIDKLNNFYYSIDPFYLKLQNKIERRKEGYAKINFYPKKKLSRFLIQFRLNFRFKNKKKKDTNRKKEWSKTLFVP